MNNKDHDIVETLNKCSGGQSVPNFDYAMAPGVLKTFKKELKKCLKFGYEDMVGETAATIYDAIDAVVDGLTTISLDPVEVGDAISKKEELPVNDDSWQNMVARAYDRAFKATDKATYQAMEGLVHNLNTMHSRAGAQVPFSSLNFGTDTTPEGRIVIKNLLLATEAGLRNRYLPGINFQSQGRGQLQRR